MNMQYRFLGDTGLRVSEFALGTMTFGGSGSRFFEGVGGVDAQDARRMIDMALEHGINLVDTADVYSRGLSEEILGHALSGRRDRMLIATKVHGRMSDDVNSLGQSRHHIIRSCEASLRRLGTDHIDILQLHGHDAYTRWEDSLATLSDLVTQGKVRYIGCSNLSAWHVMKALAVSQRAGLRRFACYQGNYTLLAREAEHELLPMCADQGLGYIVWSPLAGGYLTGKYQGSGPAAGRRGAVGDPGTIDEHTAARTLAVCEAIANQRAASMPQVALNYLRARPGVTSIIVGARTVDQLAENLRALQWSLSAEELTELDGASDRPLPYPYWHQRQYNSARYSIQG